MEKKMLREITNDKLTPKKRDSLIETERSIDRSVDQRISIDRPIDRALNH